MRSPTAWAKLDEKNVLPLVDHANDVSAVMEQLLKNGWAARLGRIGGRSLRSDELQVLEALAFLHDLGKCNRGFWRRQFEGARVIGHTSVVLLLGTQDLGTAWDRLSLLEQFLARAGESLFRAMLAHHGRPVIDPEPGRGGIECWRCDSFYDPIAELKSLLEAARKKYPLAFEKTLEPVNLAPEAVSLYAGLLTLADWIGSDSAHFPVDGPRATERMEISQGVAKSRVESLGLVDNPILRSISKTARFSDCFNGCEPFMSQVLAASVDFSSVVILESETGSGKTEAALWRFITLLGRGEVDSLYFALPTRTSAVQIHGRVQAVLDNLFGENEVEAILAVPGYLRVGAQEGQRLTRFETLWPDKKSEVLEDSRWSAESPKRYLAARIAIGTVDQALMAGLKVRHAHLRATCLSRALLVVDEVHASDTYMTEVLAHVLANHKAAGGHALLLSATLGAAARVRLLGGAEADVPSPEAAVAIDYPAIHDAQQTLSANGSGRSKTVVVELAPLIGDPTGVARLALSAAKSGARVLVIRNTVADAIATLNTLEELVGLESPHLFRVCGISSLHHGRFAYVDRRLLDDQIEEVFGKTRSSHGSGVIAIGTQTLEMSLDLDADLMISDLAPMDVLLQRLGRLHRHDREHRPEGFTTPRLIVSTPPDRDLSPFLGKVGQRHGLGAFDGAAGGVYANLTSIEATWREIEACDVIVIPANNRKLVEAATHPLLLEAIECELGWQDSAARREGSLMHDRHVALHNSLDMGELFDTLVFPGSEESIQTRLGTPSWRFTFECAVVGPFGQTISEINVPAWMLDAAINPEQPIAVHALDGQLRFSLGKYQFAYDRRGLVKRD